MHASDIGWVVVGGGGEEASTERINTKVGAYVRRSSQEVAQIRQNEGSFFFFCQTLHLSTPVGAFLAPSGTF